MALAEYGIHIDTRGFINSHIDGNSGHTFISSVEELIHNSIDANSKNIYILRDKYGSLIIVDDGEGMNAQEMQNMAIIHKHGKEKNTIGKYGVGMKDALFCLGKKWYVLSKKMKKKDLECAIFNIDLAKILLENNLEETHKGKIINIECARNNETNIYKEIIKQLSYKSYTNFSGTILFQKAETNIVFEDEEDLQDFYSKLEQDFTLLIQELQLRIINKPINIYYGNYQVDYNSIENMSDDEEENQYKIIIDTQNINKIEKYNWLSWDNKIKGKYVEFVIYLFITKSKTARFGIYHKDNFYLYCNKEYKLKKILEIEKYNIKKSKGKINVRINILAKNLHKKQLYFYQNINYNEKINGIMISRNNLDLYTYPKEWGINKKNRGIMEYTRFYIEFTNNNYLDKLFGIKTNKSLFTYNMVNTSLSNMINLINNNLYDYLGRIDKIDNLPFVIHKIFQSYEPLEIKILNSKIKNNFEFITRNYKLYNENKKQIFSIKDYILDVSKKMNCIRKIQIQVKTKKLFRNNIIKIYLPLILSQQMRKKIINIKKLHFSYIHQNYKTFIKDRYINVKFNMMIHNINKYIYINLLKTLFYYKKLNIFISITDIHNY